MRMRWVWRLRTVLILTILVGVAIKCELVRRKIVYCRERSSYCASQVRSLRNAIERYDKLAAAGPQPDEIARARAKAKAEYQSMLRWYERAERAFKYAATHPWVSTPHDPDIYLRGFPDSTYP